MWVPKERHQWIREHAFYDEVLKQWLCAKTGAEIQQLTTGRSIHIAFGGGLGEVRQVTHPYCPKCESEPDIPYGKPILEKELVNVV